jgi:calcium-dependent protein kinase
MAAPAAGAEGAGEPLGGESRRPRRLSTVTSRLRHSETCDEGALAQQVRGGVDFGAMILAANHWKAATERYEIEEKLGEGGFASVYKVKDRESGQIRAMKSIQKSASANGTDLLEAELSALIRLEHPNLAQFYNFFEQDTSICIIVELCTLGDYSHVNWKKEPKETVKLRFRDVMRGVAYCHDQQVAHRDLKFDNCLLTESGGRTVGKIVDFGLAHIKRPSEANMAMHEQCGTVPFMAPEVVGGSDYGLQCDLWSFGVMLYVATTMQHPLITRSSGLSVDEMVRAIKSSPVRTRPMEMLEQRLVKLLKKLLVKEPEKRISALDALEDEWFRLGAWSESRDCSMISTLLSCVSRSQNSEDDGGRKPSKQDSADLQANLGSFSQMTRFEKTVMMLAAHQQDSELREEGLRMFGHIDKNSSGEISFEEFRTGLKNLGITVEEADLRTWFATVDSNNSGSINYREWLMLMFPPNRLESQEAVRGLFVFFDADDDGRISREELCAVIGDVEADSVMSLGDHGDGDRGGDGTLDFEEFREVIVDIARRRAEGLGAKVP